MKQSKVIAYVGANSDHPHAADIVTALLSNTDIEPDWLIKPEPKPAYRVYLHEGKTYTAQRDEHGECQSFTADQYLTDWIEYDTKQAEKWPSDLVSRIAKIDIKAAEWLCNNTKCDRRELYDQMKWSDTPQGWFYWKTISNQLGE